MTGSISTAYVLSALFFFAASTQLDPRTTTLLQASTTPSVDAGEVGRREMRDEGRESRDEGGETRDNIL